MNSSNIQIVAGSGTSQLAAPLSRQLKLTLQQIPVDRFPNRELKLRINPAGTFAFLLGSFSEPVNSKIIEYLLIADALKRQGCETIVGIISYLAYSKQDKVFLPGEPLSAQVIAALLQTAGLAKLYTIDLHNPKIADYFNIPVTNLSVVDNLAAAAKQHLPAESICLSPDAGATNNAKIFASNLNLPLIFATKHRDLITGQVVFTNLSGSVRHKHVYLYDDMIATGSTLIELSEYLKAQGAASVHIYCTHHLYVKDVQAKLDAAAITSLTVTNTIAAPDPLPSPILHQLDISSVLASQLTQDFSL